MKSRPRSANAHPVAAETCTSELARETSCRALGLRRRKWSWWKHTKSFDIAPSGGDQTYAEVGCARETRLAGYYHWGDPQSLDQAVAVARRHRVDLGRIEEWSRREGGAARFRDFVERLAEGS